VTTSQTSSSAVGPVPHPAGPVPAPIPGVSGRPSQSEEAALEAGIPAQPTHVGAVMTGEHERSGVLGAGRPWDWADAQDRQGEAATLEVPGIEVIEP